MKRLLNLGFCLLLLALWPGGAAVAQQYQKLEESKKKIQPDTIPAEIKKLQQALEQLNKLEEHPLNPADLEIDGLVVDETISKIGRDFYDLFHRQWEPPPQAKNFIILIKEKPTPGNWAFVTVAVNEKDVFDYQLQPRADLVEEVANYTVTLVYEFLVNDQLNKQLEAEGKKEKEVY
jgi:curli production assembly/transport component CsgE